MLQSFRDWSSSDCPWIIVDPVHSMLLFFIKILWIYGIWMIFCVIHKRKLLFKMTMSVWVFVHTHIYYSSRITCHKFAHQQLSDPTLSSLKAAATLRFLTWNLLRILGIWGSFSLEDFLESVYHILSFLYEMEMGIFPCIVTSFFLVTRYSNRSFIFLFVYFILPVPSSKVP